MESGRLNIAVIGAGVAGIVAAYVLQRQHRVTLFEKNNYLGGHTNTIVVEDGPDAGTPVDTGFIVLNDRTYPLFNKFLSQLRVPVRDSDMSFGFHCERTGLQYATRTLSALFAQRANLVRPVFLWMLREIVRFHKLARRGLSEGRLTDVTLGRFVRDGRFAGRFVDHYLVPIGAAIWSTPPGDMMHFPAETILRFFENHGLLALNGLPQWQTVVGGSHAYVNAFRRSFQGAVHLEARIEHVRREPGGVVVRMHDGVEHRFDRVVLAAHADEALRLLADATADERRLLGAWTYQRNLAVLHTDESVMPPNRRAWASWNYTRETGATDTTSLSMTYHMNRLQGLQTRRQYFVTLNRAKPIPEDRVIRAIQYTHPMFTFETVRTQKELSRLNDNGYTFFCGSYFGYGFHEDAVRSAVAVAHRFGLEL